MHTVIRRGAGIGVISLLAATGCLGTDTLTSDAGRFPEIRLTQRVYIAEMSRSSTRVFSIDVHRFNYPYLVRFRADSVPTGMTVAFSPDVTPATAGVGTAMTVTVTNAAETGSHRIVVRASGVVVRSTTATFTINVQ